MADDDSSKIIVDEGWKARVQREKEEAEAPSGEDSGDFSAQAPEGMPEPTFETLVGWIGTRAMMALGGSGPAEDGRVYVDPVQGGFWIDILSMLRGKTKGNCTPEEEGALTEAIAQLQQIHTACVQHMQDSALHAHGVDPSNLAGQ